MNLKKEIYLRWLKFQFSPHRKRFYQILGRAAADGRPVVDVMMSISRTLPKNHPMGACIRLVMRRLRSGGSGKGVATIGSELRHLIPEIERNVICAGEAASRSHDGYMGASEIATWTAETKKIFIKALATPAILVVAMFGLLYVISEQIMPEFTKMVNGNMPANLQRLDWLAKNYITASVFFAGSFIALFFLYRYSLRNIVGNIRPKLDATIFRFSIQILCAYFMQNIANFISSGMSIVDAIGKISETDNVYLKSQCSTIMGYIRKGVPFEETLSKVSLVPKKYHWVLAAYGMMSDKDKMYFSIANEIKEDLTETVKKGAAIINLIVLLLFAGLMGFTYFTLMDSAMNLSKQSM